jgi:hypothetical protein
MHHSDDRVHQLIAGRRAGTVSMAEFKRQIEDFSLEELAELAAALLEKTPMERKRMKRELLGTVYRRLAIS